MSIKVEKVSDGGKIINIKDAGLSAKAKEEKALAVKVEAKVKKLYDEQGKAFERILEKTYALGEALNTLKEAIGHGTFQKRCEVDLGLNYKRCQRAMEVAAYKPKLIEIEELESVNEALTLTKKWKAEEKEALAKEEDKMFKTFHSKENAYILKTAKMNTASEVAKVKKPVKPWKDYETNDYQNTENHYKSWKRALKASAISDKPEPKEEPEVGPIETVDEKPSIVEVAESAFSQAMLVVDKFYKGNDKRDCLSMFSELIEIEILEI